MKKQRVCAFTLVLAVCIGLLAGTAGAMTAQRVKGLTPEIARDYLAVVDDLLQEYGGYSAAQPNDGYQPYSTGLAGGFLRDFDRDGTPEMVVILSDEIVYGTFAVYTWRDGEAVFAGETEFRFMSERSGSTHYSLARVDGSYYLCGRQEDVGYAGATWSVWETCYTLVDGSWVQNVDAFYDDFQEEWVTQEEIQSIEDMSGIDYPYSNVVVDGQEIVCTSWEEFDQAISRYADAEKEYILGDRETFVPYGEQLRGLLEEVAASAPEPEAPPAVSFPEDSTPAQLLEAVSYYGDVAACAMTDRQAQAFAQVLNELPDTYTTEWGMTYPTCYAALVDVAGDGMPLLFTAYGGVGEDYGYYPDTIYFGGDLRVWTWDGEKAVSYPCESDLSEISPEHLVLGTHGGVPVLCVGSPSTFFDDASILAYYTVAQGQLTPLRQTQSFLISGDETRGAGVFFRDGKLGYYEADAEELEAKQWTYHSDYGYWLLLVVNGEVRENDDQWEFTKREYDSFPGVYAGHEYTGIVGGWNEAQTLAAALTQYAAVTEVREKIEAEPDVETVPEAPEEDQTELPVEEEKQETPGDEAVDGEARSLSPIFWIVFIGLDAAIIAALICLLVILKKKRQ